ncbi:PAS domain S-box protein [Methylocucumis oryzae]|uniref:PAS domain S-box protein n=1 Tax=Methylocucumis oryzae TaxID=1632867 RepID=UPI0009E2F03C|nr:PAS domain S-box protein [Methylocucumis oryzae]
MQRLLKKIYDIKVIGRCSLLLQICITSPSPKNVERYLTNFVANFPGFVYIFRLSPDGHGSFPFASPGIEKLYGLKPEDVQDDMAPLHAMAHPEDASHIIASLEQSARTLLPVQVEFRICRPGMPVRWVEFHSVPEHQDDGSTLWYGIMQDITERKQMQEALIAREQEFRSLAENLPDNIARWDIAGRCLYSNPIHQRTLGKTLEEMRGKTHSEVFADNRFAFFDEVMAQVISTRQEAQVLRVPVPMPDGGTDYHDVRLAPEFDSEGRITSVLGIGRNMTDAYRMQETIAQREQEFRSLAESSPVSIIRYDREGRISYLNGGLVRHLGISPEHVIGKLPSEVWPDGRYDSIQQAAAQALETETKISIELCAQSVGEPEFNQIQVVPERDIAGQVIGTLAFGMDISAIRNAERRLTNVFANFPGFAFSFLMSPEGHYCFPYASPGIEKLYGLKPEDIKNDMAPLHVLAHPEDRLSIEAAIAESAQTMVPFNVEFRLCRPDQAQRWVECRSVPTPQHDGSIIWHGLMIEITERKQAEAEQQRLLNILEQFADFVGSANMDGTLSYHNRAARRMVGLPDDADLSSMRVADMHPKWAAKRVMEEGVPTALAHGVWRGESALLHRDGREIPVSQVIILHRDTEGRPAFMSTIMQDITERKQTEARLVLQNHALNHIGEAVYLIDEEARILHVNNAASNMLGYTQDELLAMRICDIDPDADPAKWQEHWDDLLIRGTITLETNHRSKMGKLIPTEVNANAIAHEGCLYNFALVRDISERKQAQETLQHSQSLLENAQRIAHIGIWDVDMLNDVLTWSDETFHIWEIDKTSFKATFAAFLDTVHPEDRDKVTTAYNQAINDKSLYQVEHRLLFPDGRIKYIHERGEPFFLMLKDVRFALSVRHWTLPN